MRKVLLLCCLALMVRAATAQQQTITGKVTDGGDGSALPGVSIVVKGTSSGTVSDSDGQYSIVATPDDVLVFSFIGITQQ